MKSKIYIIIFFAGVLMCSCKKYLDQKNNLTNSGVETVSDVQQLLDDVVSVNLAASPYYGECSADNYYLTQQVLNGMSYYKGYEETYTWGKYPFDAAGTDLPGWGATYAGVMIMNVALEALDKMTVTESQRQAFNSVRGSAFAFRSWYFWQLVIAFSKAYNEATADKDLGIPLRLSANLNEASTRPSVRQTYTQIINDLDAALKLLPNRPQTANRPCKQSVYGMLANVYLSMRQYDKAGLYADSSLQINRDLLDFNTLNASATRPISQYNNEISIYLVTYGRPYNATTKGFVDTLLYKSYADNDLRKIVFFKKNSDGTFSFKGSFGQNYPFVGIANDEMFLVKAEAEARAGNSEKAMEDLNILMRNRMINTPAQPFVPITASSAQDALQKVLTERRKELIFRERRWMDIKRLNLENANIILTRNANGQIYTLLPNANRYAIPLPEMVLKVSGMPQNPE